ncbi:LOW QUALITY PROTEIN: hypothetical protein MAR_027573 [Mya arenaria]|uniref:Uncharacterized protein n=1 Tax=Mya arenaria TaxID=6604 RepID=A0ABY7ETW0_MYAAR|nr:LOW QUALITY PROTEIN: hypothetical protein MAR_027573 [Mya arenaria]
MQFQPLLDSAFELVLPATCCNVHLTSNVHKFSWLRYKGNIDQQELQQNKSYFTFLSLSQQVLDILKRDGMGQCLEDYRKSRCQCNNRHHNRSFVQEPCDDDNFLSSQNNITLLFNTDGIPLYKSSEFSGLRYKGNIDQQELQQNKSYFSFLSLSQQVLDILKRDGMGQCLEDYRKSRCQCNNRHHNRSFVQEPCDDDNFLSSQNNITLLFNTDGIPLYKSSGVSIWPFYLVGNELPPKMRSSKKNMILWGMLLSKGKPVFQTFATLY